MRDDRVKELADKAAAAGRCAVTETLRSALEQRPRMLEDERAERRRKIDAILAELDAGPDLAPGFTDKDLHDENGDPIL